MKSKRMNLLVYMLILYTQYIHENIYINWRTMLYVVVEFFHDFKWTKTVSFFSCLDFTILSHLYICLGIYNLSLIHSVKGLIPCLAD